ncbi:class I SAM-dependent methyltransferase [Devosia sp. CN2-171]|uniref:class I SAM-dependent methyltransferase n=1 Tax=Devosia sp. CN2-171 TaxID=3400909 RepID=UPI003BF8CB05
MSGAADTNNAKQYGDSRKLAARARLNQEYTIAEVPWFEWVAGQLPLEPGSSILDIGSGPGWFWASVAKHLPQGIDLTLADLSPGMVREAVERCQPLPFAAVRGLEANATDLPFPDGSFDLVIAMHMLYHVRDQEKALAEMHRVLKPGGTLAVTTNGIGDTKQLYELGTAFGGPPYNIVATYFGFDHAEEKLRAQFGNVTVAEHPARMRITNPEDVFLALTSYPPGDSAGEPELALFRARIDDAFAAGGGVLETEKQTGLFISRKA